MEYLVRVTTFLPGCDVRRNVEFKAYTFERIIQELKACDAQARLEAGMIRFTIQQSNGRYKYGGSCPHCSCGLQFDESKETIV